MEKEFLIEDLSGRGYIATLTEEHIRKYYDLEQTCESTDYTLSDYLEIADIGKKFINKSFTIKRLQ
jgi:hypothetical protein